MVHRIKKHKKSSKTSKEHNKLLIKDIIKKIQTFYEEDTNSKQGAGKKEFITRHKIKKQKRYLVMSLKNLYNKFITTNAIKVSYSTFCKYRPFWVVFPKSSDRDTCACQVHVNMNLLIVALHKAKIINETSHYDLINSICCLPKTENCLLRNCNDCKYKCVLYKEFNNENLIKFSYWCTTIESRENCKVKRITTKKNEIAKPLELIKKLDQNLNGFLKHTFTIEKQYIELKSLKESLDINEAVIHMDWSENYDLKYHEEVQSMHFGGSRRQVSLHTSVLYLHE
ncbi:unnamed protein product [Chilo suppressalis]|uniref:Uncharacterized protein n=1 Tax=Chilo suppressalis TaxID=168631 RepID=A0ABN8B943_CHISP|nr:unnamed protein product [Chilo suppressalis]